MNIDPEKINALILSDYVDDIIKREDPEELNSTVLSLSMYRNMILNETLILPPETKAKLSHSINLLYSTINQKITQILNPPLIKRALMQKER